MWDFAGALPGDATALVELTAPGTAWWADAFPGASYATRLSSSSDLLGVFEVTDTALLLRGVVSPEGGLMRTELRYDPPATVLAFPLREGDSFTSTSMVSGVTVGLATLVTERYTSTVDASGTLRTPFGETPALRVRTTLERTLGLVTSTTRQFAFVAECFGIAALAVSQPNEPAVEFTTAAELRRLAP